MMDENRSAETKHNEYLDSKAFKLGMSLASPPPGEEVVISGMSGIFPDSRNINHFRDNLYNKVDLVSADNRRWEDCFPEIPYRTGKIYDVEKLDAGFFGFHYRQAQSMDPMARLTFEKVIEAILDAGIHPSELAGTKTGVYVGACFSENETTWCFKDQRSRYNTITGNIRSMIAHRISYYLKLRGPSHIIDTACSSSLYAMEQAFRSLRTGQIDLAIVGGTNLTLHPIVSFQFAKLGVLSKDGYCKVFDDRGDGYARSEAISCVVLQRAKDCRRNYAEIIYAKVGCDGFKPQSITYPSGKEQKKLLQEFYQDCNVDPASLSFLEAHGTGTSVGDPEELHAIDEVFCKNRTTPLLLGSVKSNIGHTEPSSGLCSIVKAVLGMENGLIPPNLHYQKPRRGVEGLEKGRMKVVTEKIPFEDDRGLIGASSFGFGGGNAHILLRWNRKTKANRILPKDNLPRLVCVSGRIKSSCDLILDDLKNRILDVEYIKLLHQIFSKDIPGFFYKSFSIVAKSGEIERSSSNFCDCKRPLCLIFTNFGKSWTKIANQLYVLPLFAASIQRIHNLLLPKKVNITEIVLNGCQSDKSANFNEIMGTMTLQIAIVDILKILEVEVDHYIGLNFGEIICGYVGGLLSLQETVLSVYEAASENSKILDTAKLKADNSKWLTDFAHLNKSNVILEVGNLGLNVPKKHSLLSFNKTEIIFINFLEILGQLYQFGHTFAIDRLYPKVEYPVSRSTPMISPLISWSHNNDWFVPYYKEHNVVQTGERDVNVTLLEENSQFLKGHSIDGRILLPATAYLLFVWETFLLINGDMAHDMQIVMENCKFLRATTVPTESTLELLLTVQRGTGNFEVMDNETVVAVGTIRIMKKGSKEQTGLPIPSGTIQENVLPLKTKDVYKELRLRGYYYTGAFRRIVECDGSLNKGVISWDSNWITFLDAMLQMKILQMDSRNLYVPIGIRKISIDSKKQKQLFDLQNVHESIDLPVYVYKDADMIKCGGVEIQGLQASSIPRRKQRGEPVLEKYEFVPNETELTLADSVRVIMQLILENLPSLKVKTVEMMDDIIEDDRELLSPLIYESLSDLPLIQPSVTVLTKNDITVPNVTVQDGKLVMETDCTLVVGSNLLQSITSLKQAFIATKDNGFVLSRESLNFEPISVNHYDVDLLTVHTVGQERFYLMRKTIPFKAVEVVDITNTTEEFSWLPTLQKAVEKNLSVIVVAQNEPLSGILGLVNCIRREPGCVDVKAVFTFDGAPVFDLNHPFYSTQLKKNFAVNVFKHSQWGTYRHLLLDKTTQIEREHVFCNALTKGDLSSLTWLEGPLAYDAVLPPEKDMVYAYYCSINFRDVMSASGRISSDFITSDRTKQEFVHGFEYSGRTKSGKRVMGIVDGALTTLLAADKYFVWPCPDHWSLEDAATIPVVYATVYYCFFIRCHTRRGQSILIHAGSGGVGQAAINVALHYGLKVYTTVGTKEKREFIKKTFPQLTDEQIGNSRDTSFEQMILTQTKGRGVDYVLNSLAEEKLLASVQCLALGGNFLEIGKFDLASNNTLRLKLLQKNATFYGIMVDGLFSLDPQSGSGIQKLLTEGLKNGAIKPLVRTVFKMEEIEQAFRHMAAGKHIGKVTIQVRKEEETKIVIPSPKFFKGLPRFFCNPENVYIIIGGLGGFGLELADWLILRGAKHLVLTSRKGVTTGYQSYRINIWTSYGTRVHISTADVTKKQGCQQLIEEAASFGTIESIFNLAVVLKDGIFENQTADNFRESLEPKAFATKHLDEVTRQMCPKLRDFVIFSSVSCGRGNAGQSNYGMANSIMERVCEKRKEDGFPALAIEWGAIGDVGLVADLQEEHTELEIGGTLQQRISSCLRVLDKLLIQKNAIVSSMVVAEKRRGLGGVDNIVDVVAQILGLGELKTVSLHASLSELGMDSMTAVEIKQTLEREYEVFLTAHDIRNLTLARLQEIQEERALEDESAKKDRAVGGFEMIIRLMTDEETFKLPLVRLESKVETKSSAFNVIFFSGVEGVAKLLAPLAAHLDANVYCIQYAPQNQCNTISEMAEVLLPVVESLLCKSQPFNFVSYSFGAVIALEITSLLEAKGYIGTVTLIDGAPYMLKELLKNNLNIQSEAIFQTGFLMQVMSLYMPMETILKNREKLLMCNSFEDRLDVGEQITPENSNHSIAYLKEFARAAYGRVKALSKYEVTYPKIKSKLRLFKPQSTSLVDLDEDYKLSEICVNPVNVSVVKGNHFTILENVALAEAVNSSCKVSTPLIKETISTDEAGKREMSQVEVKAI